MRVKSIIDSLLTDSKIFNPSPTNLSSNCLKIHGLDRVEFTCGHFFFCSPLEADENICSRGPRNRCLLPPLSHSIAFAATRQRERERERMHSFGYRANALLTFAVTILAILCAFASLSDNLNVPNPSAHVQVLISLCPNSPSKDLLLLLSATDISAAYPRIHSSIFFLLFLCRY